MRQRRTSHRVYGAWEYRQEIEDLNRESRAGWQLVRGGCFYSRFERDEGIVYRYQIDFRGKIENMPHYLESFRDQGWEYVNSTFNGWHFFRKAYDPGLPDSEYEIYTDEDSIAQMHGRWRRMAMILGGLLLVAALAMVVGSGGAGHRSAVFLAAGYLSGAMLLFSGVRRMGRTPGEARGGRSGWVWLAVMIVCFALSLSMSG